MAEPSRLRRRWEPSSALLPDLPAVTARRAKVEGEHEQYLMMLQERNRSRVDHRLYYETAAYIICFE